MNKRIVAVVVTYNRLSALRRTLSHLLTQPLHAIVVVDNASTDGTQAFLADQVDERVHVLTLPENLGGAGGFHAGVDYAHTHLDYDYLLLQDDDAWPEGAEWSQFIHSDWFPDAVATAVYYPSGTICPMNRPGWHPFKNWRQTWRTLLHGAQGFHVSPSHFQAAEATEVDFSSFVGLLVHR
ncbi:MAG TPA: glycosyltransferase, partial [Piscirickettsiaceae bacterium]|nr:glycosyltransferase [Piscirickettsiaceae bacterium]